MNSYFVISQADGRPMYLQIMEQIKQRIAVGDWSAGDRLPSIRELAVDLRISVITIKRAYQELEREGVIVTQQGKGCFVAPNVDLSKKLHEEALTGHLRDAIRVATGLGLSIDEVTVQLRHIHQDLMQDTSP